MGATAGAATVADVNQLLAVPEGRPVDWDAVVGQVLPIDVWADGSGGGHGSDARSHRGLGVPGGGTGPGFHGGGGSRSHRKVGSSRLGLALKNRMYSMLWCLGHIP